MGKTQILSSARLAQGAAFLRSLLLSAAVAAIALAGARSAHASGNVCADGAACSTSGVRDDDRYFRFSTAIGQQTPPVASVLIATCSIAKADIWEVTKVNVWFIGVLLAVLLLVTYVPVIPMGLVDLFYG